MKFPSLWSGNRNAPNLWSRNQGLIPESFWSLHGDLEELLRAFDRLPSLRGATGTPKVSIAEGKDAFEVTLELPGVDEKDVNVSIEDNQLVVSGEKREETQREEQDWRLEERSYGAFYRSIPFPFRLDEKGVEACLDKGVLRLRVAKPAETQVGPKKVDIRRGAALEAQPATQAAPEARQEKQGAPEPQQQAPQAAQRQDKNPPAAAE
jgi:HSP20 family protein